MENKWKRVSSITIPPCDVTGFQEMVVIREPLEPIIYIDEDEVTSVLLNEEDNEPTVILNQEPHKVYSIERVKSSEEFILPQFPCVLGKGTTSDVTLSGNKAISRRHAQIVQDGDVIYLEDLGSSNRTFLNDEPIDKPVELNDGCEFRMADEVFMFHIREEESL